MALSDVKFENNLGSVVLKRCLISVSDQWEWNGRAVRKVKTITVEGHLKQDDASPELYDTLLTDPRQPGRGKGGLGTLTVPWTTLSNVAISSIDQPEGVWLDYHPISVTFIDEYPDANLYTVTWRGVTLHSPRISVDFPSAQLRDEYMQMPLQTGVLFNKFQIGATVMRTKSFPGLMGVQLSGYFFVAGGTLPDGWEQTFTMRAGMSQDTITGLVPAGYPLPFNLGEAVPELAHCLPLANVILASSRLNWDVEQGAVQVQLDMLCQPQRLVVMA